MAAFADSVDHKSFKVQNSPEYVFLCGGRLDDPAHSLRAQFYELKVKPDPLLTQKVKLAEVAAGWYRADKQFDDLLELEEYLAGLSACVLLFLESPGAIAELGAFTQMPALRAKLLVVIEQSHSRGPSFIVNGPIDQMTRSGFGKVLSYPWLIDARGPDPTKVDIAALDDTLDDLAEKLQETLAGRLKTTDFESANHGHRMLLIADLLKLCVVSFQGEIQAILTALHVDVKQRELARYLFLLDQLDLIASGKYGNVEYYFGKSSTPDLIWYAPKTPMDRIKLADRLNTDFPINSDIEKKRALVAHRRRGTGGLK